MKPAIESEKLRAVMRAWPAGVAVVTAVHENTPGANRYQTAGWLMAIGWRGSEEFIIN